MNKDQQITNLKQANSSLYEQIKDLENKLKINQGKYESEVSIKLEYKTAAESYEKELRTIAEKFGFEHIKSGGKQVSVDIFAICKDNGIKCPHSMTLSETKKLNFVLKNLFQELKGHGE